MLKAVRLVLVPTLAVGALNDRAEIVEVGFAMERPVVRRVGVLRGDAVPTLGMGGMAEPAAAHVAAQGGPMVASNLGASLVLHLQPPKYPELRLGLGPAARHVSSVPMRSNPRCIVIRLQIPLGNQPRLIHPAPFEVRGGVVRIVAA